MTDKCYAGTATESCGEDAVVTCKKCDGEFCKPHYDEAHPDGRCIHY